MAAQLIPLYQGTDWAQELDYFTDESQSTPLDFSNPVMDLRDPVDGSLIATFDTTGTQKGLATVTATGVLKLSMSRDNTATLPPGIYPVDVFADVSTVREVISPRGTLQIQVIARITQDDQP